MTDGALRAGVLDRRARDRAPRRAGAPFQRCHEQRLLRHRRRRQGDRVQRALRRPRVHEHHEPARRQLAGGDGADRRGEPAHAGRAAARGGLAWCSTWSRPTTRCGARGPRRTTSRSSASASKPPAATCSSPRPSPAPRTATAPSAPPVRSRSRAPRRRSSRRARVSPSAPATVPVLEWRRDVGDERYLEGLRRLVAGVSRARAGRGEQRRPARRCCSNAG